MKHCDRTLEDMKSRIMQLQYTRMLMEQRLITIQNEIKELITK